MPAEVMSLEFLFDLAEDPGPAEDPPTHEFEVNEEATEIKLPFRYNAIHDIESVWWVGVWMMFFHKPGGYNEPRENSLDRQLETSLVFPGTLVSDRRLSYVRNRGVFREYTIKWISKGVLTRCPSI